MSNQVTEQRPPSPPHSNDGDFGLNAGRVDIYPDPFTPPRTVRPASRTELAYGMYDSPQHYPPVPQQVYYSPQPTYMRQIHYHTPPGHADPGIMTRSGKTLGSPMEPKHPRDARCPRVKKRATKGVPKGVPIIDQPLSVLTKDYKLPVRDMGAWVNRSVEIRMEEVAKKKGYVSRPMNSFMLYRSAYAERVKQFCKENNHQVVSQVTGQSWPLEPQHVREMYEQYANLERDNHAAAHPTYKFAPNKNGKKRGRNDEEEESDSDDEWRGPGSNKRSRPSTRGGTRSLSSTPFEGDRPIRYSMPMYHQAPQPHPSSYQAVNPHGPVPFQFGPAGMAGAYYHPQPVAFAPGIDDIKFKRATEQFPPYDAGSQLIGMPDSNGNELLGGPNGFEGGEPVDMMLDPRLADFDPNYSYAHYGGPPEHTIPIPRSYGYDSYASPQVVAQSNEQLHPGMATLTEGWVEDTGAGSDFDSEFQKWN